MRSRLSERALYPAIAGVLYLLLCAHTFWVIHSLQNHFTFALDDPYIHLALSEQIAHGHYGINPGEAASPSSSILWPFLLAPFASLASQPYIALLLNLLCGLATAVLAGLAVAAWPANDGSREELLRRSISAAALVLVGNLVGLTFLGMEHTLQVLLAAGCAWGIVACLQAREIPRWCLLCAVAGPMVRYESLGLSLALALALYGQGRPRRAVWLLLLSLLPLATFSLFLHHLGLPWLPTSILVKSEVGNFSGFWQHLWFYLAPQTHFLRDPHRNVLTVLAFTLLGLAWREPVRTRRFALAGAAAAALLHMLVGKLNWFFRYEIYVILFSVMVILYVLHERPRMLLGWYVLGLIGCSFLNFDALQQTPPSAHSVYLQQYQTHRFFTEFYNGNVAVNDLGLVSYRRPPGQFILDLYGLGSVDAALQAHKSTAWMDEATRRHNVGVVAMYPNWLPAPPADWTYLGQLCIQDRIALGGRCVEYFVTPLAPLETTRAQFQAFLRTLPNEVTFVPPAAPR